MLFVMVNSSHALVTGVIVIDPSVLLLLSTHNRSLASVTLFAVIPGGKVAKLNFRKERHTWFPLFVTRRLPLDPKLPLFLLST